VRNGLLAEMPDVLDRITAAGGWLRPIPGMGDELTAIACRRRILEREMRIATEAEPHVTLRIGHADDVIVEAGAVSGVRVDGEVVDADIVIAAAGRASKFGNELRAAAEGGPTGFAYACRDYRARPGVAPPEAPIPMGSLANGYLSILFPQDNDTLSALIVRPAADRSLAELRHTAAYEAAVAAIPNLAPWTDPVRYEPIGPVLAGAGLHNPFSIQGLEPGAPPARGLYFIGDALCTTNPAAGRGVCLGIWQAQHLLSLLDDASLDDTQRSVALDAWADTEIRPWFHDHVYWDKTLLERLAGNDIDLDGRIPSDVICAAAEVNPAIFRGAGPYMGMLAGPAVLDQVEEEAREVLRTGWRPSYAAGPTRDELVDLISAHV
jgi:2-polyprenyl-6-methoxyphenol hydroxylase-like FAD-dependent oxidoreductase